MRFNLTKALIMALIGVFLVFPLLVVIFFVANEWSREYSIFEKWPYIVGMSGLVFFIIGSQMKVGSLQKSGPKESILSLCLLFWFFGALQLVFSGFALLFPSFSAVLMPFGSSAILNFTYQLLLIFSGLLLIYFGSKMRSFLHPKRLRYLRFFIYFLLVIQIGGQLVSLAISENFSLIMLIGSILLVLYLDYSVLKLSKIQAEGRPV